MLSLDAWALDKPQGEVKIERKLDNYNIRGRNSAELRAAMDAKGPLNKELGKRFDARTDWEIDWTYKWDKPLAEKGVYRLSQWTIQLNVKVILPRWENSRDGLPFERRRWQVYQARLQLHEAGHVKLAERTASALDETFSTISLFPSRDAANFILTEGWLTADTQILSSYTEPSLAFALRSDITMTGFDTLAGAAGDLSADRILVIDLTRLPDGDAGPPDQAQVFLTRLHARACAVHVIEGSNYSRGRATSLLIARTGDCAAFQEPD